MADKPMLDLLTKASECVAGLGGHEMVGDPHDADVLALFDRCRSMLGAIRLLLWQDFVHEAVLLGRPLFNDSLTLAELARVEYSRRAELVIGWKMASLADLEGVALHQQSRGDDATEELQWIAEQRAQVEEYARRLGVG